jgi:hypothetical protein
MQRLVMDRSLCVLLCQDANNYRPVTLVPAVSKVLEKVIVNQLIAFLNKHNILNKSQFGFRKNRLQMMQ